LRDFDAERQLNPRIFGTIKLQFSQLNLKLRHVA
jgi:hypothetical protein